MRSEFVSDLSKKNFAELRFSLSDSLKHLASELPDADDQLRAAESVFEGDEFIEKWSQLDKSQGFSIETAIGTAELLISEARVTAVLRKDHVPTIGLNLLVNDKLKV